MALFIFTPQPLRAVRVLSSPMMSGWAGGWRKFLRVISQKQQGVGRYLIGTLLGGVGVQYHDKTLI